VVAPGCPIIRQKSARKHFGSTPNSLLPRPPHPGLKSNRSYIGGVGKRELRYALEKKHHLISRRQDMRL